MVQLTQPIFFSLDTSSPGIHSKKCVVIEFDNVEK
jgi:hypothetical protein